MVGRIIIVKENGLIKGVFSDIEGLEIDVIDYDEYNSRDYIDYREELEEDTENLTEYPISY